MRPRFRKKVNPFARPIDTWATVGGAEQDVAVEVDYQPAEPDVNVAEGIEVTAVWFEDQGCILDQMSEGEIKELEERLFTEYYPSDDSDDYGDWAYEQERERD